MSDQAEAVVAATIAKALKGSTDAQKLILDRLAPARRDRPVCFSLPTIVELADIPKAQAAVLEAVAAGELTPSEGASVAGLLDARARSIEMVLLEERLAALEAERKLR